MCGFAGVVGGRPANPAAIESILDPRGPDGRGLIDEPDRWLLHRRLAVIDPVSRSDQPYQLPDGSVLLYNGELYNHSTFVVPGRQTKGDTEVVAHLGDRDDAIASFRGMYAYALHRPDGSVHLVRDRFGIKPLYLTVEHGALMYASQLRCFRHGLRAHQDSHSAMAAFRQWGAVVGTTALQGVYELSPGTHLVWRGGRIESIRRVAADAGDLPLGRAMRVATERHLVADVPTCVLLSGGVDSGVIAKLAAEAEAPTPTGVTLSVGGALDETERSARTARQYGLEHEIVSLEDDQVRALADDYFAAMDQPTIDGLNTFLVTRAVRDLGFKVALSGLGADELFGGYAVYRQAEAARLAGRVPEALYRRALGVGGRGLNVQKFDATVRHRLEPDRLAAVARSVSPASAGERWYTSDVRMTGDPIMNNELVNYMHPMLLRDADAFSMANSVELRVPFLDDDLFAAAVRRSRRARGWQGKADLVRALDDSYLAKVCGERKTGFRLPMSRWFDLPGDETSGWVEHWLQVVTSRWLRA